MLKSTGALCLLLVGCATGGVGANRESTSHASTPRLAMTAIADSQHVFPAAQDPQLPSADRLRRQIRDELGDVASADVRLCVSPDGRVRKVELVRGSSLREFNDAVVRDIADWQFSGIPGATSDSLQSCEIATISYRPHL